VNLIALRAFGSIGLDSFVAIRRRQRGQITTGCFGRGPIMSGPMSGLMSGSTLYDTVLLLSIVAAIVAGVWLLWRI
jgi:hypothetical protein